ncbi:MAG: antitoxin [ANME-2 cluster archaeon]|nr:antitoxin [ANME-2 cluster archaeon]MBC2701996.1 antitoxin [ANME-2 cluster archaeon]MBC2708940.1 antitoxin [ANME-2 cluster archaeon]MBC2745793.1 antitoxin [ANME-2 cluster archaeon]
MSAKTISIRPDLYEILNSTKGETESFSNVIERLVKEKKVNLSEFFGVLSDSRVLDELDAESKKMRENSRVRI